MEVIPHRDADTLLSLINALVAPGTIIHSDKWAAYNQVLRLSNASSHDVVNHFLLTLLNQPLVYIHKM